jgi:hypothetical protein
VHVLALDGLTYNVTEGPLPGLSFETNLYGLVRFPYALERGPFPLVLLLHGNYGTCRRPGETEALCVVTEDNECPWTGGGFETVPNAEGLLYLADTLAAAGFLVVSVGANALNCRGGYVTERAELLLAHLRQWLVWTTYGAPPVGGRFIGAADLSRVGVMGHSRGGEAVAMVPERMALSSMEGVRIASIMAVAPTDMMGATAKGAPFAVVVPSCDGDVINLEGIHLYDRLLEADTRAAQSQVFFVGANHNFFNEQWLLDDNQRSPTCEPEALVGGTAQRRVLEHLLVDWFRGTLVEGQVTPYFRADAPTPATLETWAETPLDLRWSHESADRLSLDGFDHGRSPKTNGLGLPNSFEGFVEGAHCYGRSCDPAFPHRKHALRLAWTDGDGWAAWELGGLDASDYRVLSLRLASPRDPLNEELTIHDLVIRLIDGSGHEAELSLADAQPIRHGYWSNNYRSLLQSARLSREAVAAANAEFDWSQLGQLQLQVSPVTVPQGRLVITDIALSN